MQITATIQETLQKIIQTRLQHSAPRPPSYKQFGTRIDEMAKEINENPHVILSQQKESFNNITDEVCKLLAENFPDTSHSKLLLQKMADAQTPIKKQLLNAILVKIAFIPGSNNIPTQIARINASLNVENITPNDLRTLVDELKLFACKIRFLEFVSYCIKQDKNLAIPLKELSTKNLNSVISHYFSENNKLHVTAGFTLEAHGNVDLFQKGHADKIAELVITFAKHKVSQLQGPKSKNNAPEQSITEVSNRYLAFTK